MSEELVSLYNKINWANHQINSHQKRIEYWAKLENNLRIEYGSNPKEHERIHIRKIKQLRKAAVSDFKYWSDELIKLKHKLKVYAVFE